MKTDGSPIEHLGNLTLTMTFTDIATNESTSLTRDHVMYGNESEAIKTISHEFDRAADYVIGDF